MIWKWICRVYFQQVKSFIVNLGINLRIRYFNKIKLNVFVYAVFLSFNTFSLLKVRFDIRSCSLQQKMPHMCKTWGQGAMFVVAVAMWCPDAPPGEPPLARTAPKAWWEPVCHSCSRTGTSHSTELLIYGKQASFIFCGLYLGLFLWTQVIKIFHGCFTRLNQLITQ